MTRRETLSLLGGLTGLLAVSLPLFPFLRGRAARAADGAHGSDVEPLEVPHDAWKELVSAPAYAVLFQESTERPGSSPLNDEKRDGCTLVLVV
jgi:peptide-methionine (R)-S-oxide reductase